MSTYRRRLMMQSEKAIKPYMHFEALEDGLTISLSRNSIEYSLDGSTWVALSAGASSPAINTGEKIYVKGEIISTGTYEGSGTFTTSKKCNVGGNIMSLLYSDDFENQYTLTQSWVFAGLFFECQIVNVSEDLLSATTLSPYCYYWMFAGCYSLLTAPKLPATILTIGCYQGMFYYCTKLTTVPDLLAPILVEECYAGIVSGCSSVNYIKMMAIDISAQYCLSLWVEGVALTGTFVKNKDATWNVTGTSGIPSGWTVITE